MEINSHHSHISHTEPPMTQASMLCQPQPPVPEGVPAPGPEEVLDTELQVQLLNMKEHYRIQTEMLNRQFEEQRRMLEHEQHSQMQGYMKIMMAQRQQQEIMQHQRIMEEERLQKDMMEKEKINLIKNKAKDEQSAIASSEVKLKLRECLLNKGTREMGKNSPPDFRQWATQHRSLEQHSPPTSGLSPPLRATNVMDRLHPLRKTFSEPSLPSLSSLKMRPSMRHKVPRNSPMMHRRDYIGGKKKHPLMTSEPNLKVRLALKQKMIDRRSSPLLRRKDRYGLSKRNPTTPLTIDTTLCSSNPDSGPSSPPSSSQGSGDMSDHKDEAAAFPLEASALPPDVNTLPQDVNAFPLEMMSKMVINQSMPNISIGQPRDKMGSAESPQGAGLSLSVSEAELRARAALHCGMPLMPGSYPFYPNVPMPEGEMSPTNPALVDAQLKALELARSVGQLSVNPAMALAAVASSVAPLTFANSTGNIMLADLQAAQARLQRPPLHRTQSAPLPLPGQLLWNHQQMLLQKQQDLLLKETQKNYLKQKLQTTLLNRSGSKNHMENVDESVENRLATELREPVEQDDVVIVEEPAARRGPLGHSKSHDQATSLKSRNREAFLLKMKHRTLSGGSPPVLTPPGPVAPGPGPGSGPGLGPGPGPGPGPGGSVPGGSPSASMPPKPFERTHSSPIMSVAKTPFTCVAGGPPDATPSTGLAYDAVMLKHSCQCGTLEGHPENPGRLQSIWTRLAETGLASRCDRIKSRKATPEELRTCHSEAYVHMYGSNSHKWDPQIFELFFPRFTKLQCGGIGVDSDTVWNQAYTPQAARTAAGCVIDLAFKVARGELQNGFALVRPPGHHAEDTQAMGFCYFNNIAIAAKLLLDRLQMKKILILDWDVHHGNSTQQLFYTDPRVLYISLHRHDNGNFFPGTGGQDDMGIDKGVGFTVNVPWAGALNPPMGDAEYFAAFRTVVMPVARAFGPEIVLVSSGFDAAAGHPAPLGGYSLSAACFGHMTQQVMGLAGGRVVLVLEGGYQMEPVCDAAEMCTRALLGEEMPLPMESEACRRPCESAARTLDATIKCQEPFWPCLAKYRSSTWYSMVEAQRDREEADTVSAFASLSVVPGPTPPSQVGANSAVSMETSDLAEQPMEES